MGRPEAKHFEYDVALSFAGEDRSIVEAVASAFRAREIRVFYDAWEKARLWGTDLYQHLDDIYQNKARYCLIFISQDYVNKAWAVHELRSAQARAFGDRHEYILPIRVDDTDVPGILRTTSYYDLRRGTIQELCDLTDVKLGNALYREIAQIGHRVDVLGYQLKRLSGLLQGQPMTESEAKEYQDLWTEHSRLLREFDQRVSEWRLKCGRSDTPYQLKDAGIPGNNG